MRCCAVAQLPRVKAHRASRRAQSQARRGARCRKCARSRHVLLAGPPRTRCQAHGRQPPRRVLQWIPWQPAAGCGCMSRIAKYSNQTATRTVQECHPRSSRCQRVRARAQRWRLQVRNIACTGASRPASPLARHPQLDGKVRRRRRHERALGMKGRGIHAVRVSQQLLYLRGRALCNTKMSNSSSSGGDNSACRYSGGSGTHRGPGNVKHVHAVIRAARGQQQRPAGATW